MENSIEFTPPDRKNDKFAQVSAKLTAIEAQLPNIADDQAAIMRALIKAVHEDLIANKLKYVKKYPSKVIDVFNDIASKAGSMDDDEFALFTTVRLSHSVYRHPLLKSVTEAMRDVTTPILKKHIKVMRQQACEMGTVKQKYMAFFAQATLVKLNDWAAGGECPVFELDFICQLMPALYQDDLNFVNKMIELIATADKNHQFTSFASDRVHQDKDKLLHPKVDLVTGLVLMMSVIATFEEGSVGYAAFSAGMVLAARQSGVMKFIVDKAWRAAAITTYELGQNAIIKVFGSMAGLYCAFRERSVTGTVATIALSGYFAFSDRVTNATVAAKDRLFSSLQRGKLIVAKSEDNADVRHRHVQNTAP